MRLMLRILFFECALSSVVLVAGWVRVSVQVWPFAVGSLKARFGGRAWARTWRTSLALLVGVPVVIGWPVLLSSELARYTSGDWLKVAALWWVLVGAVGGLLLVAEAIEAAPRAERAIGCRCGTCVARGL